jgi:multiple sugar transport system permease protein
MSGSDDGPARIISSTEWSKPSVRYGTRSLQLLLLLGLIVFGLGPILWLAKSAITPTNDTITHPISLFPHGFAWSNLREAWSNVNVARYFWNTVVIALGSWLSQLIVATTGGYVLSVLRPRYAQLIKGLLLATLFVRPSSCSCRSTSRSSGCPSSTLADQQLLGCAGSPQAQRVQRHPRHPVLRQPAPRGLPRRRSTVRAVLLFWNRPADVKPILGVVFAVLASWKDFLWPLLVLPNPDIQPLSVRLPSIQSQTELGVFLAAMFIACLVPIFGFLVFQRSFLRGSGLGGAIKG